MIDMPFPCKILVNYNSTDTVNVINYSAENVHDTISVHPNNIGESIDVVWAGLDEYSYQGVEYWLQKTKGTERILWNGNYFVLNDGYSATVFNGVAEISATLVRVA